MLYELLDMDFQILVTGVGGQGIPLFAKILGQGAVMCGVPALATETHGMAARGGSVTVHIKLGEHYPLIQKGYADLVVVLSEEEMERSVEYLSAHGTVFINSKNVFEIEKGVCASDASGLANIHLGSPIFANLVMLGYIGNRVLNASLKSLHEALQLALNNRYLEKNMEALALGYKEAGNATA